MSDFAAQIEKAKPTKDDRRSRRWIYVPYDRPTDRTGPLTEQNAAATGIVMMEAMAKARRRPYHKKKLGLILAAQRHFALEQAARGVKVLFVFTRGDHADGLVEAQKHLGETEMSMMQGAERELRLDVARAQDRGLKMRIVEDTTWLSSEADFNAVFGNSAKRYVMDRFYRAMRKKTGILMHSGEPVGGKFSFDTENRQPYRGKPRVPERPAFPPDKVTQEALDLVRSEFPDTFGSIDGFDLPVNTRQAREYWKFALQHLLANFGPYEDAMAVHEPDLFHAKISSLMNISLLLPQEVVADVVHAADHGTIPLASAEGFIRQILGWREFMRHIHRVTDGYRKIDVPSERGKGKPKNAYAGATPSALGASRPLPAAYWGVPCGWNCLDTVVKQVVQNGWSHHITRLMVLSNLATLCGFSPRELTDWFWIAYTDAYDWVVETNVLGMGTYADGGVTATKPYVSGAAYINRMSDYCKGCKYDPKKALGQGSCPFTALYWSFLERNAEQMEGNIRMAMPIRSLQKKPAAERKALRERAEEAIHELASFKY